MAGLGTGGDALTEIKAVSAPRAWLTPASHITSPPPNERELEDTLGLGRIELVIYCCDQRRAGVSLVWYYEVDS
jgi:hypothetical protein